MKLVTAWDLIGHEGTFRLQGGRATYDAVMFNEATARSNRVRLARLDATLDGIRQVNRYVDADTLVEVIDDFDAVEDDIDAQCERYGVTMSAEHGTSHGTPVDDVDT